MMNLQDILDDLYYAAHEHNPDDVYPVFDEQGVQMADATICPVNRERTVFLYSDNVDGYRLIDRKRAMHLNPGIE